MSVSGTHEPHGVTTGELLVESIDRNHGTETADAFCSAVISWITYILSYFVCFVEILTAHRTPCVFPETIDGKHGVFV
jgi:hypothetical protein